MLMYMRMSHAHVQVESNPLEGDSTYAHDRDHAPPHVHAHARAHAHGGHLGRCRDGIGAINSERALNLLRGREHVCTGKVNLVEHGDDGQLLGQVGVGNRLRLDPL